MFKKSGMAGALILSFLMLTAACGNNGAAPASAGDRGSAAASNAAQKNQPAQQSNAGGGDKPYNITIAGASPGGFMSVMTEGYASIMRKAIPGTQVTVEPGDIATGIVNLSQGKVQVAWSQSPDASAALAGKKPFPAKLDLKVAFTAYSNNPFQFIVAKDFADKYGIESLADIKQKKPPIRLAVNQKGILTEAVFNDTIKALGFTYDDVKSWGGSVFYTNSKGAAEEMQNQKIDFLAMPVFAPASEFVALAKHRQLKVIGVGNDDVMKQIAQEWKLDTTVIKKGTYDFNDKDITTIGISGAALVRSDAPEDMVYDITKTLFENLDAYRALHGSLKDLTPEIASSSALPLHPGAEKYLKEKGLLK